MKYSFADWFLDIPEEAKVGTLQRVPLERAKHVGQEHVEYTQPPVEIVFNYVDGVLPTEPKQWKEFKPNTASEASGPK